jgi:hypothetical protein
MERLRASALVVMLLAAIYGPFAPQVRAETSPETIKERVYKDHLEIPLDALVRAFAFYEEHPREVTNRKYITIINFDEPSTEYRMHVIDMHDGRVVNYLVAHGMNSGDLYAEYFSNVENSLMSSLGVYLTGEPYMGEHGLSMRLIGMQPTNSNAYIRDIVLHGASYVSPQFIKETGRLGRSDGCPAVELQYSTPLVNELDYGSVYLIYKK